LHGKGVKAVAGMMQECCCYLCVGSSSATTLHSSSR
jgi:hypothetical protein